MTEIRPRKPCCYWRPNCNALRTLQSPWHITPDDGTKSFRISSAAFRPSKQDKSVSVDIGQLLLEDGLAEDALYPALKQAVGLCAVSVQFIRELGLELHHDPLCTNWYHGGIRGNFNSKNPVTRKNGSKMLAEHGDKHVVRQLDVDTARRHWEAANRPLDW